MAVIESWFDQDMNEIVKVRHLCGCVFDADNRGNLVGVRAYKNGSPFNLTGNCSGYCILANGATVPVSGVVSGNTAYIILPDTAYAVPGPISIILKLVTSTSITTLAAITSTVYGVGSTAADPSAQTVAAWSAQITATLTALENGAVLYSQTQSLTTAQKTQARGNIGANASVVLISGEDYKIVVP